MIGWQTIARARELGAQQRGGVGLVEDPGLEVDAGREIDVGMARPRVAVDAAVLAAAVGIDRLLEGDVGRVVAGDDAARELGATSVAMESGISSRSQPSSTSSVTLPAKRPAGLMVAPRPFSTLSMAATVRIYSINASGMLSVPSDANRLQ